MASCAGEQALAKGTRKPSGIRPVSPFFQSTLGHEATAAYEEGRYPAASLKFSQLARPSGQPRASRSPEAHAAKLLWALSEAKQEHWATAAPLFKMLFVDMPLVADYAAAYAGRCHLHMDEAKQAIFWSQKVNQNAVLGPLAVAVEVAALEKLEQWRELVDRVDAFRTVYPESSRDTELRYRKATALEAMGKKTSLYKPFAPYGQTPP